MEGSVSGAVSAWWNLGSSAAAGAVGQRCSGVAIAGDEHGDGMSMGSGGVGGFEKYGIAAFFSLIF